MSIFIGNDEPRLATAATCEKSALARSRERKLCHFSARRPRVPGLRMRRRRSYRGRSAMHMGLRFPVLLKMFKCCGLLGL
ncbi:hypothetical protein ES332_A12G081700v1 [Gossypium tomentosum]|uniref:Uncharacterized protein n=1 Tax=Gossypium tomentosum TaxID=34277 RepID=A0A5D2MTZ1_GOSTO|nr:hypothetical protein ES332_A12G081700v1 [Gossypium tomentosum]